jgi:S-adenosylmethionine:tRNA ribosyltransferase-isomerase
MLSPDSPDLHTANYDYQLPAGAIAQNPVEPRDHSRLLVFGRERKEPVEHRYFYELGTLLEPGDLLVLNNTKVIPARLLGHKSTGAAVELLLLAPLGPLGGDRWKALVRPGKRLLPGAKVHFGDGLLTAEILEKDSVTGGRIIEFSYPSDRSFYEVLDEVGHVPLPPYVTESQAPADRYQTLWASQPGAVAAPTAGLHFTQELLEKLPASIAQITLHVGLGTFRPVATECITDHVMHQEWVEIPQATVEAIQKAKRVIACGTTAARALEAWAHATQGQSAWQGYADLFIYPGYQWQVVDGLITNFHLPRSSLLMLVSALVGRENLLATYQEAIDRGYRFYSFGDAMFIPKALI